MRRTKSLDPQKNDELRVLTRSIVDREFDGNLKAASQAKPGISRTMLHEFIQGSRGAGYGLLDWLAARTGRSTADLRGEIETPAEVILPNYLEPKFRDLPDWPDLLARAQSIAHYKPWVWRRVADSATQAEGDVSVAEVLDMAKHVVKYRNPPATSRPPAPKKPAK